jgi:hypothetical protein
MKKNEEFKQRPRINQQPFKNGGNRTHSRSKANVAAAAVAPASRHCRV